MGLPSGNLLTIMGHATLVNGFVATAAGVFSNELVGVTENFTSPFIASGLLLVLGFFVISQEDGTGMEDGGHTIQWNSPPAWHEIAQELLYKFVWVLRLRTIIDNSLRLAAYSDYRSICCQPHFLPDHLSSLARPKLEPLSWTNYDYDTHD
ncbi:hypothetical protein NP233_g10834 [Leucocoprinus birnbaumii]|uniref:Uncharacterized protein n=1 Tax=Leucocoprinus birnbaumii TaxID=56174 RepID=A0AAD5VHI0_9AGAR|nr:hypothetical protein NP233_g10834 [Leucocoprinus birnbaumii]